MLLTSLVPLIVGAVVDPKSILFLLLLLRGKNGVSKVAAFSAGAMTVRTLQGVLFGRAFTAAADATADEGGAGIIASTLLLVVGILLLITAVKTWRKDDADVDPDAPPPRWMASIVQASSLKTFGLGALVMLVAVKQWFFTLSAIAVIDEAQFGRIPSVLAFLFFVLAAQSPGLATIIGSAVAPGPSAKVLDGVQAWLERNRRAIVVAASLFFGVLFFWKGMAGLPG